MAIDDEPAQDAAFIADLRSQLRTKWIGQSIQWFDELDSTNDYVKAHAKSLQSGTVVGAHAQHAGRGTHGRTWSSPHGQDLYLSLFLRDSRQLSRLTVLTLGTALAVQRTCEEVGISATVKWPNDILAHDKKLSGTLIETSVQGSSLVHAVVGVGINVNRVAFPLELADEATSLSREAGRALDRCAVLAAFLQHFETMLELNVAALVEQVQSRLAWLGESVVVDETPGVLLGLTSQGALRLATSRGEKVIVAGRVRRQV